MQPCQYLSLHSSKYASAHMIHVVLTWMQLLYLTEQASYIVRKYMHIRRLTCLFLYLICEFFTHNILRIPTVIKISSKANSCKPNDMPSSTQLLLLS